MAHRITYKPTGIILSSALGDLSVAVDGTYVDVSLTAYSGMVTILSERYYAYLGDVTLCDLGSVLEAFMRNHAQTYADFTLSVFTDTPGNKGDSCVLHILYCDRYTVSTNIEKFLSENFLTTLAHRRVPANATLSLFHFAKVDESVETTVTYSFRVAGSDEIRTNTLSLKTNFVATSTGIVQLQLPLADILTNAATFASVKTREVALLSFTVVCGQRSLTFFVDNSLDDRNSFFFRNCFNVWDFASLPLITTAKTDVNRSTAILNGTSEFYDQTTIKTYEVETAPLTSDEALWIDQLFTSHEVFRIETDPTNDEDPLILAPVLITESTCEVQDSDEKLNSVKFTWRYADNRPLVRLTASPDIFTQHFNIVYS